jgi:hypothetical protein
MLPYDVAGTPLTVIGFALCLAGSTIADPLKDPRVAGNDGGWPVGDQASDIEIESAGPRKPVAGT